VAGGAERVEVDGLLAGLAVAGPALEDRLQQQHGLFECQAAVGLKVQPLEDQEAVGGGDQCVW